MLPDWGEGLSEDDSGGVFPDSEDDSLAMASSSLYYPNDVSIL